MIETELTEEYLAQLLKEQGYKLAETNRCILHPETNKAMVTFGEWWRSVNWEHKTVGVVMFASAQIYSKNRAVYLRITTAKFTPELFLEKIRACYEESEKTYQFIQETKDRSDKVMAETLKRQEAVRLKVIDTYILPDNFQLSFCGGNEWSVSFKVKEEV